MLIPLKTYSSSSHIALIPTYTTTFHPHSKCCTTDPQSSTSTTHSKYTPKFATQTAGQPQDFSKQQHQIRCHWCTVMGMLKVIHGEQVEAHHARIIKASGNLTLKLGSGTQLTTSVPVQPKNIPTIKHTTDARTNVRQINASNVYF